MPIKKIPSMISVFALGFILNLPMLFAGPCAMCKMGLEQSGDTRLTMGFYLNILLLVSIPLIIISCAGIYFYKAAKNRLMHLEHGNSHTK